MSAEPEEQQGRTFATPLLWAAYGSLVIVAVIAFLNSQIGRGIEDEIDAPARTLVAAPVVVAGAVVFIAGMLAVVAPEYRRPSLRVAEIAGWLIPAWLVMAAMVLGAIRIALHHVS